MNIYAEFRKNKLRLQVQGETLEIKLPQGFYEKVKGKQSYHMFLDKTVNTKISAFVMKHRNKLGPFEKLKYVFLRNRALLLVDKEVQPAMTIRLLHAYATLALDARVVYIFPKPDDFSDENLESLEKLINVSLNNGRNKEDTPLSKLPIL